MKRRALLIATGVVLATGCQEHDPLSLTQPRRLVPKLNRLVDGEVAVVNPTAINSADELLGFLWAGNGYHAGISVNGVGYDLGVFDTASTNSVYPEAISDQGLVVWFEIDGDSSYSLIWKPDSARATTGVMRRLPNSPRGAARVTDVNDAGQAVGYLADQAGLVLWQDGQVIDLPNPPGAADVYTPKINRVGQIVGAFWDMAGIAHAFLWTPSMPNGTAGAFVLLQPSGSTGTSAVAVNDFGQVLISSFPMERSWLWTPTSPNGIDGQFVALTNSYGDVIAVDLNSRGDVSATGNGPASPFGASTSHAFLWRPTSPNGSTGQATDATPGVGFDYISGANAGVISEESNGAVQIFGTFYDSFYAYDQIWTLSSLDVVQRLTANISWAGYASEGRVILFDGRGTVPFTSGLQFLWDLGDGTAATGATVGHTYADNGTYIVRLTVTDADGHTSATSETVLVSNLAPTGSFVASATTLNEGGSYVLTLSGVSDAAVDLPTVRLGLDCGDGRGYQALTTARSMTCSAPNDAARTARAQLVDKDGAVTEYAIPISVVNVAPAITIVSAPSTIASQNTYTITFKFSDPGLLDRWRYSFDWGDGTSTSITNVATQGTTLSGSHRYSGPKKGVTSASDTVTVSVIDDGGGVSTAKVPVVVTTNSHP